MRNKRQEEYSRGQRDYQRSWESDERRDGPRREEEFREQPHHPREREQQGYFRGQAGYEPQRHRYEEDPREYQRGMSRGEGEYGPYRGEPGGRRGYNEPRYEDDWRVNEPRQYHPEDEEREYRGRGQRERFEGPRSQRERYEQQRYDDFDRREEGRGYGDMGEYGRYEPNQQGYGPGNWEQGGYSNQPREWERGNRGEPRRMRSGPEPVYGFHEREEDGPDYQQMELPEVSRSGRERSGRSWQRREPEPRQAYQSSQGIPRGIQLGGHWENELLERGGAYREEEYRPPMLRSRQRQPFRRSQQRQSYEQTPGGGQDDSAEYREWLEEHPGNSGDTEAERQFAGLDDGNHGSEEKPQKQPRSMRLREQAREGDQSAGNRSASRAKAAETQGAKSSGKAKAEPKSIKSNKKKSPKKQEAEAEPISD